MPPQLRAALLCREMGWTYAEYRAQPQWFVMALFSMMNEEAEEARRKQKH